MTRVAEAAIKFEAKKISLKQGKEGTIITLVVHPSDTPTIAPLWETWTGTRYAVAMVGLDDEEQPISTNAATAGKKAIQQAGILCRDPDFQAFISDEVGTFIADHDDCASNLCNMLGIKSRTELTENYAARMTFLDLREKFNSTQKGDGDATRNRTE